MDQCLSVGSEMDVCLQEHGHCNYISPRQACIFYDKASSIRVYCISLSESLQSVHV